MNHDRIKTEYWPTERLTPYVKNPRKNDAHVDRMVESIKEFGFRIPVVARSDGLVVDGHLRLKAAIKAGLKEVPVVLADELSEAQVKAFRILANQSANWADWDLDTLADEIRSLQDQDFDLSFTGFDQGELDKLIGQVADSSFMDDGEDPGVNPDEEWQGMPEFRHEDKTAFRSIHLHFKDQEAVDAFAALIGQKITPKIRYLWFPEIEIEGTADKRYCDAGEGGNES